MVLRELHQKNASDQFDSLSQSQFDYFRRIIRASAGISIASEKICLVETRISRDYRS